MPFVENKLKTLAGGGWDFWVYFCAIHKLLIRFTMNFITEYCIPGITSSDNCIPCSPGTFSTEAGYCVTSRDQKVSKH